MLLGAAAPCVAQPAQISGRVLDQTGGIVPETSIVLINVETGARRKTASNAEGYYAVPLLQPGTYQMTAQREGFKPLIRDQVNLGLGDWVNLTLTLEVGSPVEAVQVSLEMPLLRTTDGQTGLLVDNRRIQQLPQYERNPLAFAHLSPNVSGVGATTGRDSDFRINGGRTAGAEYILDGIPITTGYLHKVPSSVPSMEGIAELKVITGGLPAEYGRLSGGVVVVATRSGTARFKGSVYEYFRNDRLNANSWAANRLGRDKAAFHDHIFGAALGGPLRVPGAAHHRGNTFFFVSYEGLRNTTGNTAVLDSVPTELERQGDFSQSLYNGKPSQIYDWTTGKLVDGILVRQPFAGNRVPESRVDPLSRIYTGFYPRPNRAPRAGTSSDGNYVYTTTRKYGDGRWTGRLDQNWNAEHATHFSINRFDDRQVTPRSFSLLQAVGGSWTESTTVSLEHIWTLGVNSVLTMRAGVVRSISRSGTEIDDSVDTSAWPIGDLARNLLGSGKNRAPFIAMDWGPKTLGGGRVNDTRETNYVLSSDVQKLSGKHGWKAGFDHRRYYLNQYNGGNFEMATSPMLTSLNPADMNNTGHPFASFLLGRPTWGSGTQYAGPASLQTYWGAYLQDDIKLTRTVSLNLGIRWDFEPSRTERFDRQIFWDTQYRWPWQPSAGWDWASIKEDIGIAAIPDPEWLTRGIYGRVAMMGTKEYPGRTLVKDHPYRFSPRASVAWQFLPRTVLRASYGINWLTVTGNSHINYAIWNVGYGDSARMAQDGTGDGGLTYPLSFSNPFPGGAGYVKFSRDIDAINRMVMGNWWLSQTDRFSQGHEHTIQVGIQRELGLGERSWVLELNYAGNFGRSLPFWIGRGEHILPDAYHKIGWLGSSLLKSVPNPFYGQVTAGSSRGGEKIALGNLYQTNPLWQQISTTGDPLGTANYHAGYVQVERRFANGFAFLANYTLSKLMQDTGGIDESFIQGFPQAGLGLGDVWGIAHNDYRHKLLLNYSLDIPFGSGRRFLGAVQTGPGRVVQRMLTGWTLAGTVLYRGGTPLDVRGTDRLWWSAGHASNGESERPVWVSRDFNPHVDAHQALEGSAGYRPYVNASAFRKARALPNLLEVGDVGSVIPMRGPGFTQWDVSLLKHFSLGGEGRTLQLRVEAENLLNKMNPGNPGNWFPDPVNFGRISSQRGNPRRLMVAAKIQF